MICKVCGKDIDSANYCFACGWLNAELSLVTKSLNLSRSNHAKGVLTFENTRCADVEVSAALTDSCVSFALNDGGSGSNSASFVVGGQSKKDIDIIVDVDRFTADASVKNNNFVINLESSDASPLFASGGVVHRPHKITQMRNWKCIISFDINEPSVLVLDKNLVIFNEENRVSVIKATNDGKDSIMIKKHSLIIDDAFNVNIEDDLIISPGEALDLEVRMEQPVSCNSDFVFSFEYDSGAKSTVVEIALRHCELIEDSPEVLYKKIVAVDFGTNKSAVSCLDVSKLSNLENLCEKVEMLKVDNLSYDIPSCVAFYNGELSVGMIAKSFRSIGYYASSIKMHLKSDELVFRHGMTGKEMTKNTKDVVTSFLKMIRNGIISETGKGNDAICQGGK